MLYVDSMKQQKNIKTNNQNMNQRIQLRRGKEKEWIDHNPILEEGELIYVTDKDYFKIGKDNKRFTELKIIDKLPIKEPVIYIDRRGKLYVIED